MKFRTAGTILCFSILLGTTPALAQAPEAEEAQREAELTFAYEQALSSAQSERQAALESIARARAEIEQVAETEAAQSVAHAQARAEYASAHESQSAAREAELATMREELSHVHDGLRQASREVARVHRELNRSRQDFAEIETIVNLGDRAVIGVVLGESTNKGVKVLGISPDGPSERAGIEQGDVIVSMMGQSLVDSDGDDAKAVLNEVMESVNVGDEIVITVDREGDHFDYTVTAEKREPFAWQSIVRLPSVPSLASAPSAPMIIERIEIPEIDEVAIRAQVESMREEVERARVLIDVHKVQHVSDAPGNWEFKYESLSELGDDALREANVWFGLPVTRGLKLAEIDSGLGAYFDTDRGVLVLKAREDNDLQLESGDVILQVGGKQVDKPSDLMRALRDWEPGVSIKLDIKRERKDKTLDVVLPERNLSFDWVVPNADTSHFQIHSPED